MKLVRYGKGWHYRAVDFMHKMRCLVNRTISLALALITLLLAACVPANLPATTTAVPSVTPIPPTSVPMEITDITVGTGAEAQVGSTITVNYIGTLADGTKFDSSYDRNEPVTFQLKSGSLIEGWIRGIPGMKVGGKRHLVIPPELGYGAQANGPIPANSVMIFDVELLDVK
jgi:hypothetical protein